MTKEQEAFLMGLGLGVILSLIFYAMSAKAHDCYDAEVEQAPDCGYVQVVNPISGELEQQYVCQ